MKHTKCKIMRPVTFPEVLDMYQFCGPKVAALLKANRDRHGDEILGELKKPAAAAAMDVDAQVDEVSAETSGETSGD